MKDMKFKPVGEFLESTPIKELTDNTLNLVYFSAYQWYLEKECGCGVTYMSSGSALVRFPEGTLEEVYSGRSTQWVRETMILLPNKTRLKKVVRTPLSEGEKTLVALLLPKGVYGEPKEAGRERS